MNDSGLTKAIGKEIHVDMLDDIVERILLKDIERFRGQKAIKVTLVHKARKVTEVLME